MSDDKKEILVVDDDWDDLERMKEIIDDGGYKVVLANNGAEALDSLKGNGFDAVLIDIKMPTLSGYDLLRLMRERLNHHVKMIYVSVTPQSEVDMTDVDGFIQKPLSPESMLSEINRVLGDN